MPLIDELCTPFAAKQRRFSPEERRMIRAEIMQLVDLGILQQSMSPWAAQCLCIRKKDGTLRLCIDWRELNKHLVNDSGGLGDMQSIFDGLKGKKYFTQLDLASGFYQMSIAEQDRFKTAFRDADGLLWEFTRAGFGLTVLPAAFTRRVKTALGHLAGVFSWLDDILIASDTWEEHIATLTTVLTRLLAAGLSVNFAKCIFGAACQEFLGMIIDATGIRPAPAKMEAIANMPRPCTVEELRTFQGLTGYLRQFVPNYSLVAAPLTDLLRNKEYASKRARKMVIAWGVAEEKAFQSLRTTLASPTVLAFPDLENTFELHTDASTVGVGAVLMQTIDEKPRVISFASHRFSRTDSRRGPTERECMGVLWGVDHFKPYLSGRSFKLITDCSALTWLFRSRELCPKLHRWALRLSEYDMELEWKEGAQHVLPDALSRLPHSPHPQADVDESFPDDFTSSAASAFVGPRGPVLNGVRLADLETLPVEVDGIAGAPTVPTPGSAPLVADLCALQALPFATCASLDEPVQPLRRGGRRRTPTFKNRVIGDVLPPPPVVEQRRRREPSATPADPLDPAPPADHRVSPAPPQSRTDDLGEVLSAGGEVPSSRPQRLESPAVHRAIQTLIVPGVLVQRQRDDTHLGQVRSSLEGEGSGAVGGVDTKGYSVGADSIIRHEDSTGRRTPAIPADMVADVLSLVHSLHGHAGVGATQAAVRNHFHWPTITRDTRHYVLSCACRRRKRSHSRRVAMMPARPLEPWDELQMDILKIDTPSDSGNVYILLVVDRASKFPFGFPLPSKEATGVASKLIELCLTLGVPKVISCDGAKEFGAEVVTHLCRWLRADIRVGPADHPRSQGAVERLGGWLQEMLAELCQSWPARWDEYVSPALWIKRTLADVSNPSPFELLFGRKPRTSLDSLVPLTDEVENGGLDSFVERRKQNLREVRLYLEKRHDLKVASRARANAAISRPSAGVRAERGNLVLVRESDSNRHREGRGMKLQHEVYTGPWTVTDVLQTGLSVEVQMRGRKIRSRRVSTANIKPYHVRPPALRQPLADEFAVQGWGADFKRPLGDGGVELDSLSDCRRVVTSSGTEGWQYRCRSPDGSVSGWLSEKDVLAHFTFLQLDCFIALWHLYNPQPSADLTARPSPPNAPLPRSDALRLFPIGFSFRKDFGQGRVLSGQVYDYHHAWWRVRYTDNNWEELTRRELEALIQQGA